MSQCFVCHRELKFDFEKFVGVCLDHYSEIEKRLFDKKRQVVS